MPRCRISRRVRLTARCRTRRAAARQRRRSRAARRRRRRRLHGPNGTFSVDSRAPDTGRRVPGALRSTCRSWQHRPRRFRQGDRECRLRPGADEHPVVGLWRPVRERRHRWRRGRRLRQGSQPLDRLAVRSGHDAVLRNASPCHIRPDATGAWYRYSFSYGSVFPTTRRWACGPTPTTKRFNMFNGNSFNGSLPVRVRPRLIFPTGAAARRSSVSSWPTSSAACSRPILDGATRAARRVRRTDMLELGANSLNLWKFHVDWANTANTSLTGPTILAVAAFTPACGGGACVIQPVHEQLDAPADRVMHRLAYRNFGDHESLVVNHAVKVGTPDARIRTAACAGTIRSPGATPLIVTNSRRSRRTRAFAGWARSQWMPTGTSPLATAYRAQRSPRRSATPGDSAAMCWPTRCKPKPPIVDGGGSQTTGPGSLGRLQCDDHRSDRRLHVLVHERVPQDRWHVQLEHAHRGSPRFAGCNATKQNHRPSTSHRARRRRGLQRTGVCRHGHGDVEPAGDLHDRRRVGDGVLDHGQHRIFHRRRHLHDQRQPVRQLITTPALRVQRSFGDRPGRADGRFSRRRRPLPAAYHAAVPTPRPRRPRPGCQVTLSIDATSGGDSSHDRRQQQRFRHVSFIGIGNPARSTRIRPVT